MIKIMWLMLVTTVIISCTNKSSNTSDPKVSTETPDYTVEISDNQVVGDQITAEADEIIENLALSQFEFNFGQIEPKKSKIKIIEIKNTTSSTRTISVEGLSSPYTMFFNRCNILTPNSSCYLWIRVVGPQNALNGELAPTEMVIRFGALQTEALSLFLKSEVVNSVNQSSDWEVDIEMKSPFNSQIFVLNQSLGYKYVYVKNKYNSSVPVQDLDLFVNPDYRVLINRCKGQISSYGECSILLFYNKFRVHAPEENSSVITFNKKSDNSRAGFNVLTGSVGLPQSETFTGSYTAYDSNNVLNVCQGTQVATRSIIECRSDYDNKVVSNSLCNDPDPTLIYKSPAGEKAQGFNISNGVQFNQCAEGETSEVFSRRACDGGYFDDSVQCSEIQYTATLFSSYSPEIPTNLQACDGTTISSRSITECRQSHDNAIVSTAFCSDTNSSVATPSPSGSTVVNISNGTETRSCTEGQNLSQSSFVNRSCDFNFYNNGSSCEQITYTPIYSSYSPAIPTNLQACDGTVTSTRTMTCQRDHDLTLVSNSFCPTDSASTVQTLSPSGNKVIAISNGSRTVSCSQGLNDQSYVLNSGTCVGNFSYTPNTIAGTCVAVDPCSVADPVIGVTCNDGSKYMGKISNVKYKTTAISPTTRVNPSTASSICAGLVEHGVSDWFHPSISVLSYMYSNQNQIGGFISGVFYTSSSSNQRINFSNGAVSTSTGIDYYRCVATF